jgi:hypothetical protein
MCITVKMATAKLNQITKRLFSSCVVAVAFRFRSILDFSVALFVVPLAFFDSDEHPLCFFIDASAN